MTAHNSDEFAHRSDPPSVHGRRVALRPVRRQDYEYLYQLAVDPRSAFRWRLRGVTPDPRTFESSLWDQVLVQFVITRRSDDRPIGLVTCFAADMRSSVANLAIVLEHQFTPSALAGEALFLFLDYVFELWNFRKIYAEMPEFNFSSIASGASRWFTVEARVPARYWMFGQYWDNIILSIDRARWPEIASKFGNAVRSPV